MKKLIAIGILGLLLITGLLPVSGTSIKNLNGKIEKHIRTGNPLDSKYSYEVIYEPSYDVACASSYGDAVDITYANFTAWWTSNNKLCFHFLITNIGDTCYVNGQIEIILHRFYDDSEPYTETLQKFSYSQWHKGKIYSKYRTWSCNKRPKEVKLEIKSDLPEADFANNEKTIPVYSGVILSGYIRNGTEPVVENTYVKCNSDVPEFDSALTEFSMDSSLLEGEYILFAPKHPEKPPLKYNITVQVDNKCKSKFTRKLVGLQNARVNFIFGVKNRPINFYSLQKIVERKLIIESIIERILEKISSESKRSILLTGDLYFKNLKMLKF